jgi:hypothetical protein
LVRAGTDNAYAKTTVSEENAEFRMAASWRPKRQSRKEKRRSDGMQKG